MTDKKQVQVEITMGAISPPLSEQLEPFNLPLRKVEGLEKIADSITRLYLNGYIPESQTERCRKKLFKQIQETISTYATEPAEQI